MQEHPELTPVMTVTAGTMRGASFRLSLRPQVIGRTPDADIAVPDPHLSRRHAEVRLTDAGALLVDLGSTNGTWLNDRRIIGAEPLADGDVIRLGHTELRFFDPALATTDPVGLRFLGGGGGDVRRSHRPAVPLPVGGPANGPTDAWPPDGTPVASVGRGDGPA
ncbi:FHA domain-containing protein [Micromonospora halophytica]|uniref:FHA domain-containing protein n=1 Tax=Micromonospora halophytica TaxID=47864 RepID=A0A1C5HF05_9ACTN|nr:FHA domain-containing protein [Micromonospora halophytica]SCG44585.1 FHA domain-containing protein [Micromonospora halophytica]